MCCRTGLTQPSTSGRNPRPLLQADPPRHCRPCFLPPPSKGRIRPYRRAWRRFFQAIRDPVRGRLPGRPKNWTLWPPPVAAA